MRKGIGTYPAHADFRNLEVLRMANDMEGIQLTSQISKVAERVIASLFVPQLICAGAYGRNQFAYMRERGARDALAQLVLTWISMFGKQRKIAVYCSDVSGAFDKVNSRMLLRKLRARGIPDAILVVIQCWLYERRANAEHALRLEASFPRTCKSETWYTRALSLDHHCGIFTTQTHRSQ